MLVRNFCSASAKGMYRYQQSLKKLPVNPLNKTLEKYLRTVQPFLTPEELTKTKAHVEEFGKPGGLGEALQKRLEERSNALPQGWLIDWWNEWAYFGYRDPVVIHVNYFFQFQDDPRFPTQTGRAASLIQAAMDFRGKILREELEVDMMRDAPLDMGQFQYLFNACRQAHPNVDKTVTYDPKSNNHVAVVRNNNFYVFDLFHKNGAPLSTAEIEAQLKQIIALADQESSSPAVGVLSTEQRDVFAEARAKLISNPINAASLEKLESSVFLVCLDKTSPVTRGEVGRALWHGDGKNRYFDKACQFIVFENGKAGFNGEHSMMDGTPTNRLTEYVLESLFKNKINHGTSNSPNLPPVQKLSFVVNQELGQYISKAQVNFEANAARHDHHVLPFFGFGKNAIKKWKMSPDAFVQMSMQLAYFKMFGRFCATYESASTRRYLNGRTEVARTVSNESCEWVRAMLTPKPDVEKLNLLRKAIDYNSKYMAEAVDAQGCDRHLLGLRLLMTEEEKKKATIFQDKAYSVSSHWALSTSQITSEYYDGYGWGNVVPDGFGCAYSIKDASLHYNIACLKEFASAARFGHYLEESLLEMRQICESGPQPKL